MGKITGFIEFGRQLPGKTPVSERITHYNEFVGTYTDQELNQQSARCMNCGIPFCHSGCPLGNVIPEFNDAVYKQNWELAYQILSSTNNFPEFTGRICPAPCEAACVLGINKPAVAIEEIEKHIIEIAFAQNLVKAHAAKLPTGKKIGIVGSGPAGLAAADQLAKAGHSVTVFERDAMPGGLLRYGIPDFKLEKTVVERRIKIMQESGIIFRCGIEIGKDMQANELVGDFDALVLAGGSTIARDLGIEGRDSKGVYFAMEFLGQQNRRVSNEAILQKQILVSGKNVVVLGGGDTGSDCVGTAIRQGAKSVLQFELMPQPPAQRNAAMPWPSYPMLLKTTSSHEEGCERAWAITTKAFLADEAGHLQSVLVADIQWDLDQNGRPTNFTEIVGSQREIPCDFVFLALGFVGPMYEGMLAQLNIKTDARGNVEASENHYKTNIDKIFVAGDMRRGQSLVVWAISEGREAARKVDQYLMGFSRLETKDAIRFYEIEG